MEESNYKHNYEYLSIEEAKSIIGGTFVQGTTNIGGELATKADIDKLLTAADKKLTSIVPVTDTSNEFICFFECISNETFPDDLEHRWIEVSPIQFTFPADGGSVKITGSYGLTGTLGTRKKVGDIADTITAGANATPSAKSGSKTYYYNNDQSQTPTAKVSWTQPNKEEEFPDNEAHRWIRVQPESSQIPVDGGTINVTGSYGLTGTYGTEKKVGDITDTIVVEPNSTQDQKSGSKTYHYNNNQSDTPTAEITWTQPGRAEEFPDDEAHRWIEITPTDAGNFTEAGGTITVTGSYGLTGSFGTKKTVGQINDTITVERNTTTQTKPGSKTYYYNNTPGTNPSATVTWTQDACSRIDPTDVTISDITMNVGESKQLSYNVTPENSTIDSVSYEIVSGSDLAHIENSTIYADKEGSVTYKVTINNSITATASVVISDTYTYKDVYDIKSDLKIPGADNCGYVFNYNEIDSNNAKYFYVNAHRDKIGSKGNVVSSEKINYTFIKDGDIDNFTVNVNKQNNKGSDEYQIYPKLENSGNSNYELSISIKKEDSDIVFLFNAIHICKDYTKVSMQDTGFFSSIDHKYYICSMDHRISTNLYNESNPIAQSSLYYAEFNYSAYDKERTRLGIYGNTRKISNLDHFLQSNNVARGYFTLYLCKCNKYGNQYGIIDESGTHTDEKISSHTLNFNFWDNNGPTIEGTIYGKIFSITKDFTAVELSGIEYNGMTPNIIPLERYTKMYDLLFYPCASTMIYKIY